MHSHQSCAILFVLYITTISCERTEYIRKSTAKKEDQKEENLQAFTSIETEEVTYQSLHERTSKRFHEPLHVMEDHLNDMEVYSELDIDNIKNNDNKNIVDRSLQSENEPVIAGIIGGEIVPDQDRYPYMASILNSRRVYNGGLRVWHVCGGSLIKPNIVLGAAHCAGAVADYIQLGKLHISGGATYSDLEQIETYTIIDERVHPKWDRKQFYRDMVLYKLDGKSTRLPVKLSADDGDSFYEMPNQKNRILGWGKTDDGSPSAYLREADVSHIPHDECTSHQYLYGNIIKEDAMVCFAEEGKDACQGDSGGPLVHVDALRPNDPAYDVQLGVISWGVDCAHRRYPGVYAKIDYDWIESTICNSVNGLAPEECFEGKLYRPEKDLNPYGQYPLGDAEESPAPDLCKDSREYFQHSWDNYEWDCERVSHWWWYACMYYSSDCPESCCGEGNCDSETGQCIYGYF